MILKKQFIIHKEVLSLPEYLELKLRDGWILSYHRDTKAYYK